MNSIKNIKLSILYKNVWLRNIWISFAILSIIYTASIINPSPKSAIEQSYTDLLFFFIVKYGFIFIHNYFLLRLFLFRKKHKKYLLYLVVYLFFFALCDYLVTTHLGFSTYLFTELISSTMITIFGSSFYIIYHWIQKNLLRTKKELELKQRELNLLKQQISPHFLFNALNNLYGIALTSHYKISDHILNLSDLLRYQVESTQKNWINLQDELTFIENYINYNTNKINNLNIQFKVDYIYKTLYVPPLLFLPLIENAIKYSSETQNPVIYCHLYCFNNQLNFHVENNFTVTNSKIEGTKTGLINLKNRLHLSNLIYDIRIDTSAIQQYKITLSLWDLPTNV